jgi:epoxyqueuosine reductase
MPALSNASVKHAASAVGFDLCGVSAAVRHPKLARLAEWVAEGHAGEMNYLARSLDERLDPTHVLPTARSVISVACFYTASEKDSGDSAIAKYARGDDYHDVFRDRLGRLIRWMATEAGPGLEAFSSVDNGPIQERVFAEQAGLGWIGKNTCLINPRLGSWMVLGEIICNADIEADAPALDQCGSCTRCLEACPTGALPAPYVLDANRCLSYLTIELRGSVAADMRPEVRGTVFGCDICQDVCPWNRRAVPSADSAWAARPALTGAGVARLSALSDDEWRAVLQGSAIRRAGLTRVRRSLAYAAAHLPVDEAVAALDALAAHPSAAAAHVTEAIAWSRHQLATRAAESASADQ